MIINKFGGASIKSADTIKQVANIIGNINENSVIVVSAMGKMTNKFEELIVKYTQNQNFEQELDFIINYHRQVISELFEEKATIKTFDLLLNQLIEKLNTKPCNNTDYEYDSIVVYGELFSSVIISEYLNYQEIENNLVDIRNVIITDGFYKDGRVLWKNTCKNAIEKFNFSETKIYVTQGFIASDKNKNSITLGREGSDFTASILAYCLNVESVTIWKDVPGILNADPRIFTNTVKIDKLSYKESVELAYYGAQVIHPKTIKPLENKKIPLFVKSFINPQKKGTEIYFFEKEEKLANPIIIIKENQTLISILPRDFSFIEERNISKIFKIIDKLKIKVNLMENSAVSFSVVIDNIEKNKDLIKLLENDFKIKYNSNLKLITIRHYNKKMLKNILENKEILLEQKSRNTVRFVVKY